MFIDGKARNMPKFQNCVQKSVQLACLTI